MKNFFILLPLLFIRLVSFGQDIHWSQFNDNPIFQNPSNVGDFTGDYRFIANYRDQWRSVTVPFSTFNFSVDSKLRTHPELSYGVYFFYDQVGDGRFQTFELMGNVAYRLKLSSDGKQFLTGGLNFGMNHRQFDFDKFYFGNQYNGVLYDPNLSNNESLNRDKKTNFSVGVGAIYKLNISERQHITGGVSVFNLNKPNQGFYGAKIPRDIRTNIFVRTQFKLNYDWDVLPSMQFNIQGKYREFVLGSSVKYTLVNRLGNYKALYAGLWYRVKDASYITVGMDFQDWFAGISYDINLSKLIPASSARGGLEIAIRYILHEFKPTKNVHRICPDYI